MIFALTRITGTRGRSLNVDSFFLIESIVNRQTPFCFEEVVLLIF